MSKKFVITIGRQFGSGGREIGYKVAEKLGVKCYDKELISVAAKDSDLCEQIFAEHDEAPTKSFLYSLVMDTYSMGYSTIGGVNMPIGHKVFLAQFDAIKNLADQESCVIVGRCADYALEEREDVLKVFIYADIDSKIKRVMDKIPEVKKISEAKDLINKTDKKRASYYNCYTSKKWGDAVSYDLCINSAMLGIDETANVIVDIMKKRLEK